MKAAVYRRFGGPEVVEIQDVARPEPAADEILIRVQATTVSAADYRSRSRDVPAGLLIPSSLVLGIFRPRRRRLGMDVAGIVVAVGRARRAVHARRRGASAMLGSKFGGHAEYAIAGGRMPSPSSSRSMSFDEAVSLGSSEASRRAAT